VTSSPGRDQLVALLDSVTDAVFTLDRAWRLTYLNRAARDRLGRAEHELLGRPAWEVLPPVEDGAFRSAYEAAFRDGSRTDVEAWVPQLGAWYAATAYPDGDQLTIVFREVTGQRRRALAAEVHERMVAVLEPETGPVDSLLALAAELRDLIGSEYAEVWVRDRPDAALRMAGVDHLDDPDLDRFARASRAEPLDGRSAPGRALERGEVEEVTDLTDPATFHRHHAAAAAGLRSALHLPVVVDGSPAAVVGVLTRRAAGATDWPAILTGVHADLVELVARQRERHDLARFFTLSNDILVLAGVDGSIKRVNPRWTEVLGHTTAELLAEPLMALVHPDDRAATHAFLGSLSPGRGTAPFRNRILTRDGDHRVLEWRSAPIPAEGSIYSAARDVTEELRDQRLDRVQREVLRDIVVGGPLAGTLDTLVLAIEARFPGTVVALHRYDADVRVLRLTAGPSLEPRSAAAIAELPVWPLDPDDDEGPAGNTATAQHRTVVVEDVATDPRVAAHRDRAIAHGVASSWSAPILGGDGALFGTITVHRRVPARPDATERRIVGDLAQLAGIAMDRDRTERRLVESEERFRLVSQATSDAIWDWDLVTGEVTRSEGYETLFGFDLGATDRDRRAWSDRVHPEDRDRVLASLEAAVAGEARIWSDSYRFHRADGTVAQVVDRGTIIRDRDGDAVRMIGGMLDDSDRHELEQQYLRAQRLESIGTLAGGIAHDLNNVLAPIVMAADLLGLDELPADHRRLVDTIGSSARRGAGLVRQVLTFARGVTSDPRSVDPRELLEDVRRMARDTFPRSIVVRVTAADPVSLVCGDVVQLQQVLLNVAVNARDAMPRGGTLQLHAEDVVIDEAYAGLVPGARPGRYVRVTVTDTGAGMTEEVRERLFEPFFTTKEPGHGTGLGMSTTHAIVRGHLGFIEVSSELRRGTTLHIHLPAAEDVTSTAAAEVEAAEAPTRGEGQLVLVVDDEVAVREVTRQTLEASGYRVLVAADGAEAVARFARHREDVAVVVTDMMMPVMDGAATITALRRIDPDVRIIAASGLGQGARGAEGADTVGFLTKPFTSRTLLAAIAEALGARG
jgi:PAS domain S-box-containing protein